MRNSIRKAALPCLGSSMTATFVQFFRNLGVWGIVDFLYIFTLTFIITTIIVTVCLRLWERIRGSNHEKG
jgi:hypothetical protein